MPKLWDDTIEAHRRAVQEEIVRATAALVAKHGLASVTMSQVADAAGIGRATLYKYFPDVQSILGAWHEHQVSQHLQDFERIRDQTGAPVERLERVLSAFAFTTHHHDGSELVALLHRGEHVARAHQKLREFVRDIIAEGVAAGAFRGDVSPEELAGYCLHALTAAATLPSKAAVRRLVDVTLSGLRASRP